jgi:hypothetical protein
MMSDLTTKQRAVTEPIQRALALLPFPQTARDRNELENLILTRGIDLWQMCRDLETALDSEDTRLRTDGTTDELDDRWIKNLHRLEVMLALLDRAYAAIPGLKVRAA